MTTRTLTLTLAAAALAAASAADAASREPPARGQACLAVAPAGVQGVEGSAADFSSAVRDLFASYLRGPSIETVALEARLASQAVLEARERNCDQVLIASVTRKRSGGGGFAKALGHAAGAAAWHAPYAAGASSAVAYGAAAAGAHAASSLAADTRAKDQIRLGYRIVTVEGAVRLRETTLKAKATSDGEDLLTPLVAQAAEAIAPVVLTPPSN